MQAVTPVAIEANQVCGFFQAEDIAAAVFTVGARPATASETATLRQKTIDGWRALIGRKVCTEYIPEGDHLIAQASIDGVSQPTLNQKVIWVSPGDGFRVR